MWTRTRNSTICAATLLITLALLACGGQRQTPTELGGFYERAKPSRPAIRSAPAPALQAPLGSLGEYLAFALEHSPQTERAFQRWRSLRYQISQAASLPEPVISFGYFLRSVETRVGPQQYKLGLNQRFPWPTKLRAGAEAAKQRAHAAALVVDAEVLAVQHVVAQSYWTLWLIDEEHRLMSAHDAVLEALAGAVRGRLQTGAASLADLGQVDLNIARHRDHIGVHEQASARASATLRAAVGARGSSERLKLSDGPAGGLPALPEAELLALTRAHPQVHRATRLANSERERARASAADRYPSFRVGLDLIGIGDAAMTGIAGSGNDALVVSGGITVPLWTSSYSDAVASAKAASRAHQASANASLQNLEALLRSALSRVRDAQRRIELHERTLLPQAETTFEAVLGSYQTGRSTVSAVILAQRDLIDLQIAHARARADHAKAYAHLEFVAGTQVQRKAVKP